MASSGPTAKKSAASNTAPAAKGAVKKTAAKKAAGTVFAGGGPENPFADALALRGLGRDRRKATRAAKGPNVGGSKLAAGNRVLLAEFTACFVVLGLGTVLAPSGTKDGVPRLMSRGSGLCLLFFILALVSGAGPGARKAANALGGLVTVAYLVTSSDAHNVFGWITQFYSTAGVQAGSDIGDLGSTAAAAAGSAGSALGGVAGQVIGAAE
jgi:hypothetical protein